MPQSTFTVVPLIGLRRPIMSNLVLFYFRGGKAQSHSLKQQFEKLG